MGRLEVVHSRLCPFAFHSPTFPAAINNNMNPRFSALILSSSLHVGLCLSVRSPCPPSHLSTRHSVSYVRRERRGNVVSPRDRRGRDEEWGERREMNGEPRNRMNEARLSYLSPLVRLVTVRLTLVSFLSPRVLLSFRAGGEDERRDERNGARGVA